MPMGSNDVPYATTERLCTCVVKDGILGSRPM
jgi:hypothetical protein